MTGLLSCAVLGDVWSIIDSCADSCLFNSFFSNNVRGGGKEAYGQVMSNLCVSKTFQCLSIKKIRAGHEFWTFSASELDVARMNLDQGHDTPSGH